MDRVKYIVNLLIVTLLLAAVAVGRDGRLLGYSSREIVAPLATERPQESVESYTPDGVLVLNSAPIAKDIAGYGGRTPVKVYLRDGVIERVESEVNSETESFYNRVIRSGLLTRWDGLSLAEAAQLKVDGVSGATFTSLSIIGNVQRVAQYGAELKREAGTDDFFANFTLKNIVGLLVILGGVVLTFVRSRRRSIEVVQMVLNVAVLGFWCGSFLSLSQLVSWLSNGVNLSMSLLVVVLLGVVVVVPLFGRKGSYCHLHCPMGSAQELLGRLPVKGVKIGVTANQLLNRLRYFILLILLFIMWLGVGFELMDYEIFSAFVISSASTAVLIMAAIFLVLSIFVPRPYCRFVCPTGALITISQRTM